MFSEDGSIAFGRRIRFSFMGIGPLPSLAYFAQFAHLALLPLFAFHVRPLTFRPPSVTYVPFCRPVIRSLLC